jgi:hypothetical protein
LTPERWEFGSTFPIVMAGRSQHDEWLPDQVVLHGTGRQALSALLEHGRDVLGWRRVLLPSYSCPDVARAVRDILPARIYATPPGARDAPPKPGHDEALLVTALFGIPPQGLAQLDRDNVILDATHDPIAPWLADVDVPYVVASLRKTLPVPDGAVTWSPRGLSLPKEPPLVPRHVHAVEVGVRAMYLKSEYLDGANIEKDSYLRLFRSMEQEYAQPATARISAFSRELIRSFPVHEWRRQRLANIRHLSTAVRALLGLTVLPSTFGVVVRCRDHVQRERVRLTLLRARIYPAILWQLPDLGTASADHDFSRRMLFLHADFRWGRQDMDHVANQIALAVGQ